MSLRKLKWRGIGRLELLAWLNEFLETDYTKIEHLADGIAYCQIFDALYPGKVNLQQLNFHARTETEFERNFKVLRRTFHVCDIRKEILTRKLTQGIFQEHFEFLHWIHDYVHRTCPDAARSYHGFERRQDIVQQSQLQNNSTNTNLIPKYSSSMKTPPKAYVNVSSNDADEGVGENTYVGEFASPEDKNVVCPGDDFELYSMDPLMQSVRHSFRSTARAQSTLAKLEECLENVRVEPSRSKPKSKKEIHPAPKSRFAVSRQAKIRAVATFKDPAAPDPMMCRYISDLIECLESELLGRVKDLQNLENNIATSKQATIY